MTVYIKTFFLLFVLFFNPFTNAYAQHTVFNNDRDLWAWKGDNYVSVMWQVYPGKVYYDIYRRSPDGGEVKRLNRDPVKRTNIIDHGSGLSGHYEYFVQVRSSEHELIHETEPLLVKDVRHTEQTVRESEQISQTIEEVRQHITTDLEFRNFGAMTLENIQNFLENANSFLAEFETEDATGTVRPASEIIFNAANEYGINPQAILTTLQKEQGLISTQQGDATQYQLDWATGYAVGNERWRGFGNQVERAAWQFDKYYMDMETTGTTVSGWGVLIAKETEDCLVITPRNMATAALYTYTPLAGAGWGGCTPFGGNFLYWDLFYNRYGFDAGPEGDFEVIEPDETVGCSLTTIRNAVPEPSGTVLLLLPALFAFFRFAIQKR